MTRLTFDDCLAFIYARYKNELGGPLGFDEFKTAINSTCERIANGSPMTRQEICEAYDVDNRGVVRSPGKFEGEMLYVPHFWDQGLEGAASEDENGMFFFVIDDDDRKVFPEIDDIYGIALGETESGVVYTSEYDTKAEYDAALENMRNLPSDEDSE